MSTVPPSAHLEDTLPLRRVIFFGDSRADWWHLPVLPGFQCVNAGVPGATAAYLARHFQAMVAPLRPDIVVVQMGVNDLVELTGHAPERERLVMAVRTAIASVVSDARALGARVILTTIFPLAHGPYASRAVQEAIAAVNQGLSSLAAPEVRLLDSAAVLCGSDGYVRDAYADDEAHLNAAGYAALNAALAPLLRGDA
ncbi:MAG: GDSL-type esterase/lipase family protein [Chloroflexaceae bacterium]